MLAGRILRPNQRTRYPLAMPSVSRLKLCGSAFLSPTYPQFPHPQSGLGQACRACPLDMTSTEETLCWNKKVDMIVLFS